MRILVIEETIVVASWLRQATGSVHAIEVVATAAEAARTPAISAFDVIVVDLDVGPDHSGALIIAELRRYGIPWPVIAVSTSADDRRIVEAVNAGADEFFVRPMSTVVLAARLRGLVRRSSNGRLDELSVGDVRLSRTRRVITGAKGESALTAQEYSLLELFLSNWERVVPRTEVLAKVWGFTFDPNTSVLEVAVNRVRRKLASVSSRVEVMAVRNVGFTVRAHAHRIAG